MCAHLLHTIAHAPKFFQFQFHFIASSPLLTCFAVINCQKCQIDFQGFRSSCRLSSVKSVETLNFGCFYVIQDFGCLCDNVSVDLCIIGQYLATMHCGPALWCTADKVSLVLYWIWNKSTAAHFWWLPHDHRIRVKYWKRIVTSAECWSAHPVHLSGLSRCRDQQQRMHSVWHTSN